MVENFVKVEFKDGKASFDISVDNDAMLLLAIAGLEGYVSSRSGLAMEDIRELIDESKQDYKVKPKEEITDGK